MNWRLRAGDIFLEIRIKEGDSLPFENLIARFKDLEYDSEILCEAPGQYAVRGGVIDVYPVNSSHPYRIDFFGDEVESISAFDPGTQLSSQKVKEISIAPIITTHSAETKNEFFDYLPDNCTWLVLDPISIANQEPAFFTEFEKIKSQKPNPIINMYIVEKQLQSTRIL